MKRKSDIGPYVFLWSMLWNHINYEMDIRQYECCIKGASEVQSACVMEITVQTEIEV